MKTKIVVFAICVGIYLFTFQFVKNVRSQAVIPEPDIYWQTGKFQWSDVPIESGVICWARGINGFSLYTIVKFHNVTPGTTIGMQGATCERSTSVTAEQRRPWAENYWGGSFTSVEFGLIIPTITVSNTKTASRTPRPTGTFTPTAIPAPWPTIIFTTNDNDSSTYFFTPQRNELCSTWHPGVGRLGPINIPDGKGLMIVKFLEDQDTIPVNVTWCEASSDITPEERVSFHIADQPNVNSWNNSVWFYIGKGMSIVTLTPTPTVTTTPSSTVLVSATSTATETMTETSTSTRSPTFFASATSTKSPTMTYTASLTRTSTSTSTRSSTPTVTPVLAPDKIVPSNVSTLHLAKAGHICYGQVVGGNKNSVVEFVSDYSTGIEISGGGCFTQKYYSLNQVMRFLESRGIRYGYVSLPRPTLTPSRTLSPTITIANNLVISIGVDGVKDVLISEPGTVCWGKKVGNAEYKVVRFQKVSAIPVRVVSGGCTVGQNLSAEDVFNYLRRVRNTILLGFVEIK
jgi:hypothetical protein